MDPDGRVHHCPDCIPHSIYLRIGNTGGTTLAQRLTRAAAVAAYDEALAERDTARNFLIDALRSHPHMCLEQWRAFVIAQHAYDTSRAEAERLECRVDDV